MMANVKETKPPIHNACNRKFSRQSGMPFAELGIAAGTQWTTLEVDERVRHDDQRAWDCRAVPAADRGYGLPERWTAPLLGDATG